MREILTWEIPSKSMCFQRNSALNTRTIITFSSCKSKWPMKLKHFSTIFPESSIVLSYMYMYMSTFDTGLTNDLLRLRSVIFPLVKLCTCFPFHHWLIDWLIVLWQKIQALQDKNILWMNGTEPASSLSLNYMYMQIFIILISPHK